MPLQVPIRVSAADKITLLLLFIQSLTTLISVAAAGVPPIFCQNGATYDDLYGRCHCSPHYYGEVCETAFAAEDPCKMAAKLPVLSDPAGRHRPGSGDTCGRHHSRVAAGPDCVDFSVLKVGWYRIKSPWGNHLVEGCNGVVVNNSDCGSTAAYVLHERTPEGNSGRALFKAKAFQVWQSMANCHISEEDYYPVRLLVCSAKLTLYFIRPLPTKHHCYCIGGNTTVANTEDRRSEIKPVLKLHYRVVKYENGNSKTKAEFHCRVFRIRNGHNENVAYSVRFLLTLRSGKTKEISNCRSPDVPIPADNNSSVFVCPVSEIFQPKKNIYGSTLICIAKPNMGNTTDISSNIHSFTFGYNFSSGISVIRPDQPVKVCINTSNVPVIGKITFSISIGRRLSIPNDRMRIAVLRSEENDTKECDFSTTNKGFNRSQVCIRLVLYNKDAEGKVVFGLSSIEQMSVVKLNISYKSAFDGLNTYTQGCRRCSVLLDTLHLKVNLSSQVYDVQRYLHIFSDPYVKPVGGTYTHNSIYELTVAKGENVSYTAMRHKLVPYEVQVLLARPQKARDARDSTVTTRVAIRYGYNIITVFGSANSNEGALQYRIECKLPKRGIEKKNEQMGHFGCVLGGVEIEQTSDVIRIKFLFYGTIIYVWNFRTTMDPECTHKFVMSQLEMRSMKCTRNVHKIGDDYVLDVMIVPGVFDTEGNVHGLMYMQDRNRTDKLINREAHTNLFSSTYEMKTIDQPQKSDSNSSVYEFNDVLNICQCPSDTSDYPSKGRCFVNVTDVVRNRRDLSRAVREVHVNYHSEGSTSGTSKVGKPPNINRTTISPKEAKKFCSEFLLVRLVDRNYSIAVCSNKSSYKAGTDYATQFEFLCVRHALTLGTYQFADSLLNSMLDMCRAEIGYNATKVRNDSRVLKLITQEMCPDNCTARGVCLAGVCACKPGFSGRGCENLTEELKILPTLISMPHQDFLCSSENCSSALLLVTPLLKTTEAACSVRHVNDSSARVSSYWNTSAVHASGSVMMCSLREVHDWLRDRKRLFVIVEMTLESATWRANNSVRRLVYQSRCSGLPTKCFLSNNWTCTIGGQRHDNRIKNATSLAVDGNLIDSSWRSSTEDAICLQDVKDNNEPLNRRIPLILLIVASSLACCLILLLLSGVFLWWCKRKGIMASVIKSLMVESCTKTKVASHNSIKLPLMRPMNANALKKI